MLSGREFKTGAVSQRDKQIIEDGLDYPYPLEEEWDTYRLGEKNNKLFMADLTTPITVTAVATAHRYTLPFDAEYTKFVFYQRDATFVETDNALNIRVDFNHPNGTPETVYYKQGVSWPTGGTRLTGVTFMPASELVITVDGTATNLLYVSMEFRTVSIV